jgi:hypothetical protein
VKRWAVLTMILYAIVWMLLLVPIWNAAFNGWGPASNDAREVIRSGLLNFELIWAAVFIAGQALLLLEPVKRAESRPQVRRSLKLPVIVAGFFLANLTVTGFLSFLFAVTTEERASTLLESLDSSGIGGLIVISIASWAIWSLLFYNFAKHDASDSLINRTTRWLLRGSILELLIAIPSHVIVRRDATTAALLSRRSGGLSRACP